MSETSIADRLALVRERIRAACARAGRKPEEITLIAVSKKQPPERVREAAEAGLTLFGENRVQEAAAKIPECPGQLSWHLVGHLQRNKARLAAPFFDMIHTVDSLRLLETLDGVCAELGRTLPVCIEVNVAGEASKFGLPPGDVPALLDAARKAMHVHVAGLMTIPPFSKEAEKARGFFRQLRALRDRCREQTGFPLEHLSMGMSIDFETAIEEGATMIRVGTVLFGERTP